jgi:hypothetical protein
MGNVFAKRAVLASTACLLTLASIVINPSTTASAKGFPRSASSFETNLSIPQFHAEHSIEVAGEDLIESYQDRPAEVAHYINKKVFEMLPQRWRPKSARIAKALIETSNQHKMDPLFLMALIQHESRFNPLVRGQHGEIGLMQIKPSSAVWILEQNAKAAPNASAQVPSVQEMEAMLAEPEINIALGTAYLAMLRDRFDRKSDHYISAYNMGSARVRNHVKNGVTPRIYKDKVMKDYTKLASGISKVEIQVLAPVRRIASFDFNQQESQTFVVR